jgi:hypothetical protein
MSNIVRAADKDVTEVLHVQTPALSEALSGFLIFFKKEQPLIFNGGLHVQLRFVFIVSLDSFPSYFGQGFHN